jgi:hypothetical protein
MAIRDGKLYRDKYETFEKYCAEKWEFGRAHAYRLIGSAEVMRDLSPIGDSVPMPLNEAQVRPLVRLEAAQRRKTWMAISKKAVGTTIRASHVAAEAKSLYSPVIDESRTSAKTPRASGNNSTHKQLAEALKLIDLAVSSVKAGDKKKALAALEAAGGVLGKLAVNPQ